MLHGLLEGCETLEQIEARRDDAANGGDWFDGYDKNPGLMIPLLTLAACTAHRIRTAGKWPSPPECADLAAFVQGWIVHGSRRKTVRGMARPAKIPANGALAPEVMCQVEERALPQGVKDENLCPACKWLIEDFLPPLLKKARRIYTASQVLKPKTEELPLDFSTEIPWDRDTPPPDYVPPEQPQVKTPTVAKAIAAPTTRPGRTTPVHALPDTNRTTILDEKFVTAHALPAEEPDATRYYGIGFYTWVWNLFCAPLIKEAEAEFIRVFPSWRATLPEEATASGRVIGWRSKGKRGGVAMRLPMIRIPAQPDRLFFWWPKALRKDPFSADNLQVLIAERWFGKGVARVVSTIEGLKHWACALGDDHDATNAAQALFSFTTTLGPQDEAIDGLGNAVLQPGCLSADVFLYEESALRVKKTASRPWWVMTQHFITSTEDEYLVALCQMPIATGQFERKYDPRTGGFGPLFLPRMPHSMRRFRPLLNAALEKAIQGNREIAHFVAERGKRRTR